MGIGKPLRVIQWATGNIGRRGLQSVIEHPRMKLVGLYVSSPDKVGQDAGALAGRDPVGVSAVSSLEEIVALDADCVLYMRQGIDWNEVCAILASGKNIVTTRGEFHNPKMLEPEVRARIEDACRDGQTSIYSTGSSPGFISEALALPVLSCQRRLDRLTIFEYGDMTRRDSADFIFNVLGYGKKPEDFDTAHMHHIKEMFSGTLGQIAEASGVPIEEFVVKLETGLTTDRVEAAAGPLEKGTVGAQLITVDGLRGGKPVMTFCANWYVVRQIDKDWNMRENGWRVLVEGDAPMDINITFPIPFEIYGEVTPGYTAHRAVNAVAAVCAAAPGIRTTSDMAQVIATF
jgi:2,4-diaminopentanoate dehydrogenase